MICPECGWKDQELEVGICLACGAVVDSDYPPRWHCVCGHINPSGADECELCGLSYVEE